MPLENGQDGKEKRYADELRHKIDSGETGDKVRVTDPAAAPLGTDAEAGGFPPTTEEVEMAIKAETKPISHEAQSPEEFHKSLYAEASLIKKITVFALTSAVILVAFGLIYAYWPMGTPPR